MGTLTRIKRHGQSSHRRTVYVDGELWRSLPSEIVRELGLAEGDTVDASACAQDIAELERRLSWERALRLLRYRGRSRGEIASRLSDDGYSEEAVAETTSRLLEVGLLDDERFAEAYARSLVVVRGLGRVRALREMTAKGLEPDLAVAAIDAVAPAEDEPDRAQAAAARMCRAGDRPERLAARLVRRGFSPGVALRAAREATAHLPECDAGQDAV